MGDIPSALINANLVSIERSITRVKAATGGLGAGDAMYLRWLNEQKRYWLDQRAIVSREHYERNQAHE